MEFAKKFMSEKAEELNSKAAMLGIFSLVGEYYFTGQIVPEYLLKNFFCIFMGLIKPLSYFSLFECFDGDPKSQLPTHSSNNFSEELFISQVLRQS
ncbi:high light inducible protein-like [Prochlorococcus marinus str. MIT 9302]|uniref:High light inducible protein-like n=1 Tax=Prochlorococcus marinus str. MIT 9302 TaxID=74545 RepID=A0A0A2A9M7_PROMR|nr:hypothetical protein [Prochlorococcus marinus]KGF97118.1 high light inducible protein-like [Prochlorococcus marinus str. MIT 9302]